MIVWLISAAPPGPLGHLWERLFLAPGRPTGCHGGFGRGSANHGGHGTQRRELSIVILSDVQS
jgi:hypothetical protein